jgi:hypothetical protein
MNYIGEFIQQCLLFKSNEMANRIFGVLAWASIGVLVFVLSQLICETC